MNRHMFILFSLIALAQSAGRLPVFGHGGSDGTIAIACPGLDMMFLCFTQSRGTNAIDDFHAVVLELFQP